jgi:hypothetical protein
MKIIEATIVLKKADFWDVFYSAGKKRIGQPFWLRSLETGKFDNKAYLVQQLTDSRELKAWVEFGMVFIPASDLDMAANAKTNKTEVDQAAPTKQEELTLKQY